MEHCQPKRTSRFGAGNYRASYALGGFLSTILFTLAVRCIAFEADADPTRTQERSNWPLQISPDMTDDPKGFLDRLHLVPPGSGVPITSSTDGAREQIGARPALFGHSSVYDPIHHRMIVFGGAYGYSVSNDVWAMDPSDPLLGWTKLQTSGTSPSGRFGHSAMFDPTREQMIVFAGYGYQTSNRVWRLNLSGTPSWTEVVVDGPSPTGRMGHTATYDPVRDRMIVFGGEYGGQYLNDVWALTLSGTAAWEQLTPGGTAPTGRAEQVAIYDGLRDRLLVHAGYNEHAAYRGAYFNDVWALDLSGQPQWSKLMPDGTTPPGRSACAAVYDSPRDRIVVFGGISVENYIGSSGFGVGEKAAAGERGHAI